MARRISTVVVRDIAARVRFCAYLGNLLRYRLGVFDVVGQPEIFTKFVQRYPILVAVTVVVLGDNAYSSRKLNLSIKLTAIVQLYFVHVLWRQ